MASLGLKLHHQRREAEEERLRKEQEEKHAEQLKLESDVRAVTLYFDSVKEMITDAIMNGRKLPVFTLGKRYGQFPDATDVAQILKVFQWGNPTKSIMHPEHAYYQVWAAFESWAESEDLDVSFEYTHDGMSESWQELVVKSNFAI